MSGKPGVQHETFPRLATRLVEPKKAVFVDSLIHVRTTRLAHCGQGRRPGGLHDGFISSGNEHGLPYRS